MVRLGEVCSKVETWNPRNEPASIFRYVDLSSVDSESKSIINVSSICGKDAPSRARQRVKNGDILMATVRPNLNAVAVVPAELDGVTVSTGFCVLRPEPAIDGRFLFHWMRTRMFIDEMVRLSTGANYPAVSEKIVRNSTIPLPSLAEQRRIVSILDRADAIRVKRRQVLADLDELPRSLFAGIFGNGNWSEVPLRECCSIITGNTPSRSHPEYYGDAIEWVKTDNITEHGIAHAKEGLSESGRAVGRVVPAGGLLMVCIAGSVRSIGRVAMTDREVAINQQINALVPHDGVDGQFLLYALRARKQRLVADVSMQLKGILNKGKLGEKTIPLPPLSLQREFAARVAKIEQTRAKVEQALKLDDELFASLQSRAFRGGL